MLALRTSILTMHKDTEGISAYINALENAKKMLQRTDAANAFTEHNLMLVAVNALLATHQFPRTTEEWEDLDARDRMWVKWKQFVRTPKPR